MGVLKKGYVTNMFTNEVFPYEISVLAKDDMNDVLTVQKEVLAAHNAPYYPLEKNEVASLLFGDGFIAGVKINGQLIAFRAVLYPNKREDNLGFDISFPEEKLQYVAHFEASVVLPAFRNNRLQRLLGAFCLERIQQENIYHYLFATVHPQNIPSIIDKFYCQMVILKILKKYNNSLRYLFYRPLSDHIVIDGNKFCAVSKENLEAQKQLMDEGYVGTSMKKEGTNWKILFHQLQSAPS